MELTSYIRTYTYSWQTYKHNVVCLRAVFESTPGFTQTPSPKEAQRDKIGHCRNRTHASVAYGLTLRPNYNRQIWQNAIH